MKSKKYVLCRLLFTLVVAFNIVSSTQIFADELIEIQFVAIAATGSKIPVPGVLCEVTVENKSEEIWTNKEGIISIKAESAKITISPISLPTGFKYKGDVIPVLEIVGDETKSVPQEGEPHPFIELEIATHIPLMTFVVTNEDGLAVRGVGIEVSTSGGGIREIIRTNDSGSADFNVGLGKYDMEVVEFAKIEYVSLEKQTIYFFSDKTINLTLPARTTSSSSSPYSVPTAVEAPKSDEKNDTKTNTLVSENSHKATKETREVIAIVQLILTAITLLCVSYLVLISINMRKNF